jgi:glyoxylase-like metal-dependent hydrolase (beta-lactamase superfamily II)
MDQDAPALGAEKISKSAYRIHDPQANINVGFVATPDGVVVIDTGTSPSFGDELARCIGQVTAKPVRFVVNTHFHEEHTRGNGAFSAPILAHPSSRREMTNGNGGRGRLPDVEFDGQGYLYVGGRLIELIHLPGHTEGSVAVHLVDEGVLFAGDSLFVECYPVLDHADPVRWMKSLLKLRSLGYQTVVPGHGPVAGREAVDQLYLYFENLLTTVSALKLAGRPTDEIEASRRFIRFKGGTTDPLHKRNIRWVVEALSAD